MKNDAQECRNDFQKHRMTPRMTPKKKNELSVIEANFRNDSMGGAINDCFGKEK